MAWQLYMLRTMLESLISDKKKSIRFDLSAHYLPPLEEFYAKSSVYSTLLSYTGLFETTMFRNLVATLIHIGAHRLLG